MCGMETAPRGGVLLGRACLLPERWPCPLLVAGLWL